MHYFSTSAGSHEEGEALPPIGSRRPQSCTLQLICSCPSGTKERITRELTHHGIPIHWKCASLLRNKKPPRPACLSARMRNAPPDRAITEHRPLVGPVSLLGRLMISAAVVRTTRAGWAPSWRVAGWWMRTLLVLRARCVWGAVRVLCVSVLRGTPRRPPVGAL